MVKFIELVADNTRPSTSNFSLGEVWVNENYVIKLRAAPTYEMLLQEGRLPDHLDANHQFTAITTNNGANTETHIVVGEITGVAKKLNCDSRTLLKG